MAKSHEVLRRPDADVVEVELGVLEVEVACVIRGDAALGGRSTDTDLKRWRLAGDWRNRGSFEDAVRGTGDVGEDALPSACLPPRMSWAVWVAAVQ
jgi:hypothetical protein